MKGYYLITTNDWFYAPDGRKYKAAWGNTEILTDEVLGVKTNRNSTNWYAKVGSDDKHIIIAGCQINYAVRREEMPEIDKIFDCFYGEKGVKYFDRPCEIYIAE
jgi:hypothetical protein